MPTVTELAGNRPWQVKCKIQDYMTGKVVNIPPFLFEDRLLPILQKCGFAYNGRLCNAYFRLDLATHEILIYGEMYD